MKKPAPLRVDDFSSFATHVLGNKLYPRQKEVLDSLFPFGSAVTFKSCNDGGKTRHVISSAILAAMTLYRACCISTSGSFRQIESQLTPKLQSYKTLFPGYDFQQNKIKTRDPLCFWEGFSTNDPGKFEGHHAVGVPGDPDFHPLMIIVDEAKTVPNEIFKAVDRCKPTWLLLASSTGFAQGEFFASWSSKSGAFKRVSQSAHECPHWSEEDKRKVRDKWGKDHPLVRSMLDAEFMEQVQGAVINLKALEELLASPPAFVAGERKARCDFAWSETGSGDENVLALRNGNRITIEAAFRDNGVYAVCGRFLAEFQRLGLKPHEIEGDGDGKGAQIIDQLGRMGWPITPAYNGGKPLWNDRYQDRASEEWGEGNMAIIRRQFILPDDTDLFGQMLDRRVVPSRSGLFAVESKKAMGDVNRDGGPVRCSPDRADAVFGAMSAGRMVNSVNLIEAPNYSHLPDWAQPIDQGSAVVEREGQRRYFD